VATQWSFEGTWPARPESVAGVREFVGGQLHAHLRSDLVDEARLVASELATNAIRHAGTPFTVTLEGLDGEVTLWVRDGSSRMPVPGRLAMLAASGRGLFLVDALSANWGVTAEADGGKSVWARFGAAIP
jgi:anti-sigma regulatory factor (Ser/Thr protein kinase)